MGAANNSSGGNSGPDFRCIRLGFLQICNSVPENWVGNDLYYNVRFGVNEPGEV